ncbi:hypothetical protein R1flu_014521 [Riccia fluitans]|uniref:Uncharacterized protein n=1 Tax=Riccia fluitans TaxID=41844 RepID=A0ABD1YGP5_9MARC
MDRFIKPISHNQYFESLREEQRAWRLNQMELSSESEPEEGPKSDGEMEILSGDSRDLKRHFSRRKSRFQLSQVLERLSSVRDVLSNSERDAGQIRGKYSNGFERPQDWKKIEEALKLCRFSPRRTVEYLRVKYSKPGVQNPFLGLAESTIRGWLTHDKKLNPSVLKLVRHPNFTGEQFGPKLPPEVQGPNPPEMQRVLPRGPGVDKRMHGLVS